MNPPLASRIRNKLLLIWDLFDPSPLGFYRKLSRPVDGWLTRNEEAALFRAAQAVPRERCIVELGSWFGRSAILLGGGSLNGNGAPVFAVDLFAAAGCAKDVLEARAGDEARDFLQRFRDNMRKAGLDEKVTAIRGATAEAGAQWTGPPVGFLFIDADHSYEGVRSDWESWHTKLASGSKIAFHDYENQAYEGVARFVNGLLDAGALRSIEQYDSLLCGEVLHAESAR